MTRRRTIAAAVVRRTKMRAAFDHLAWDFDLRLVRIVTASLVAAPRVLRNAAGLRRIRLVPGGVPVAGPFPNVTDHVMEPVAVRRIGRYRGRALIPVAH